MKKLLAVSAVFTVLTAHADLIQRTWSSQSLYAHNWPGSIDFIPLSGVDPLPMPEEGDGIGWQIDIALYGSDPYVPSMVPNVGTSANYGWYDGYGFYIGEFSFNAVEGQAVVMRMFNATTFGDAEYYMESLPIFLPDLGDPPPLGAADITFGFHAIPEPSTVALLGIGNLGLFLARRKAHR